MVFNTVADFRSNFQGGTRQNRFEIVGGFPNTTESNSSSNGSGTGSLMSTFHVRSTLIPTLQTSTISYDYFGRKHYFPGEKLYSTWSVSVMDDNPKEVSVNGNLWKKFQTWHNCINNHIDNTTTYPNKLNSYKVNWSVNQLDLNGGILKTFYINGLWPRTINEISFSHSRPNILNNFNVVFVYDTISIDGVTL
jgi:hypothetical protein